MSDSRPILHLKNYRMPEPREPVQVAIRVKRNKPDINPQELYTPKQVSTILKISISRLRDLRWLKKGPRYIKIGKSSKAHIRYLGQDLLDYLSSVRVTQ